MRTSRWRALFLILAGLALGVALGLVAGWTVWPVEYTGAPLSALGEGTREDMVVMIATAYAADGDLEAARSALADLSPGDPGIVNRALLEQSQGGADAATVAALGQLSAALGLAPLAAP